MRERILLFIQEIPAIGFFFILASIIFFIAPPYLLPIPLPYPDVTMRIIALLVLIFLFGFMTLPWYLPRLRSLDLKTPLCIAISVWFLALGISTLFSYDPLRSLLGFPHRLDGLVTFAHMLVFFFLARSLLQENEREKRALRFLLFIGIVEAVMVFIQLLNVPGALPIGTVGNATAVGLSMVFFIFFSLKSALLSDEERGWQIFALFCAALFTVVLFLSESRGAYIGLLVFFIVSSIPLWRGFLKTGNAKRALTIGALFLGILGIVGGSALVRPSLIPAIFGTNTIKTRLLAWQGAAGAIGDRPIFGWGLENFTYAFDLHYPSGFFGDLSSTSWFDFAHNAFLDAAVKTGVLGLVAYLGMFIASMFVLARLRKDGVLSERNFALNAGFFAGYGATLFFLFNDPFSWAFFFLVLATLDAQWLQHYRKKGDPGAEDSSGRILAWRTFVFFGVLTLIGVVLFRWFYIPPILMGFSRVEAEWRRPSSPSESVKLFTDAARNSGSFSSYLSLADAERILENIIERNPASVVSVEGLSRELAEQTEQEIAQSPKDARLWLIQGRALQVHSLASVIKDEETGMPTLHHLYQSEAALNKAISFAPSREQILWALAEVKAALGKWDEAEVLYRSVIELNPKLGEAHARSGIFSLARHLASPRFPSDVMKYFKDARDLNFRWDQFQQPPILFDPFVQSGQREASDKLWQEALLLCRQLEDEEKCDRFSSQVELP